MAWGASFVVLAASGCGGEPEDGSPGDRLPFIARDGRLQRYTGDGYEDLFLKGVNLGVAVPGTRAGELAATRADYDRWLNRMGEMGLNSIRVYTLHYPRFYEAVRDYNLAHRDRPIYVFHGIWLDEENPTHDLHVMTNGFREGIREVIDCVHGDRVIDERLGRAFGEYTADISPWVMAYVLGREVYPDEIMTTDQNHPSDTSFEGEALRLAHGSPSEAWAAAQLDMAIGYERATRGTERPVSFSSWPTLDPIHHPTENPLSSGEDDASLDLANLDVTAAPAGYFATYHAYPYYPDFISDDPGYASHSDAEGSNSYVGYLLDLKAHYWPKPLVVGEVGVPSSWGIAHYAESGANHGGFDEKTQGHVNARLLGDVRLTGCAGGMLFAWIDEWWKRTWVVDELNFPSDRYDLWRNVTSPEDNFGLIGFHRKAPADFDAWPAAQGNGRIAKVRAARDDAFFHVEVTLNQGLADGETLTVGYDTYRRDLGESVLPDGTVTANRAELALSITAPDRAQLYVTQAYDLYGIWHGVSSSKQLYHSIPTDGAPWVPVRWLNGAEHESPDGKLEFPDRVQQIGKLRARREAAKASTLDAVVIGGTTVKIRIPYTLLQFTDPSTRRVMDDDRATPGRETAVSDGIVLTLSVGGAVLSAGPFEWEGWDTVEPWVEYEKGSLAPFAEAVQAIPETGKW